MLLRIIRFIALGITGGIILAAILMVTFQSYLILPSLMAGRIETTPPPEVSQQFLATPDGESLNLWRKEGDPEGTYYGWAVVAFHGNGDTTSSSIHYVLPFTEMGFTGFVSDYRGTGTSSGWPTEDTLLADAELILQHVFQEGYSAERTIVLGNSFGTGLASYVASRFGLPVIMLVSPYLSIPEVLEDRGPLWVLHPFLRFTLPTAEWLADYSGRCVIAAYGGQDTVIRPRHSVELGKRFHGSARFIPLYDPRAHHGNIFGKCLADMKHELIRCLQAMREVTQVVATQGSNPETLLIKNPSNSDE